jgi:hypothetical protein
VCECVTGYCDENNYRDSRLRLFLSIRCDLRCHIPNQLIPVDDANDRKKDKKREKGGGWGASGRLLKNLSPRICGSTSEVDKMRYNRPKVENGPEYCKVGVMVMKIQHGVM